MFCNTCGSKIMEESKFCNVCGTKICKDEKNIERKIDKPQKRKLKIGKIGIAIVVGIVVIFALGCGLSSGNSDDEKFINGIKSTASVGIDGVTIGEILDKWGEKTSKWTTFVTEDDERVVQFKGIGEDYATGKLKEVIIQYEIRGDKFYRRQIKFNGIQQHIDKYGEFMVRATEMYRDR